LTQVSLVYLGRFKKKNTEVDHNYFHHSQSSLLPVSNIFEGISSYDRDADKKTSLYYLLQCLEILNICWKTSSMLEQKEAVISPKFKKGNTAEYST
jgi:hypothetical protein